MSTWDDEGGGNTIAFGRTAAGDEVELRVDSSGRLTLDPNTIIDIGASITTLRAAIDANVNGNNTLVAAVTGEKIKVLGLILIASGDVDVRLESDAGGTALTGVMSLADDGHGFVLPMGRSGYYWLETAAGKLLNLELSAAVQVGGCVVYYTEA